MYASEVIDEVVSRSDIVDIISGYIKLKKNGSSYVGLCPFHNEKTASFSVSDQKGFYHCFGCGAHGDVINFEMNANGLSFLEAVDKLAHIAGMEVPRSSPKEQEKEKQISKDIILEAIENSLVAACKNQFESKADNIRVSINRDTGEIKVFADYEVVEDDLLEDPTTQIGKTEAALKYGNVEVGETVSTEVIPKNFGRIAAQKAKQVVVQKIREEERKVLYTQYLEKEREVITGIVQRYSGNNVCINLGKVDAILMESEQVPGEHFKPTEHIKLYVVEVKDTTKGPRITVSRTHPEFVKRLFEEEVTELQDGIVEIKSIAREAGSRTKIAVYTEDPNVDPVGACVGINGDRVNAIVDELRGEKIDIITWSDDPAVLIENALSPAKVISVTADEEEKTARVIVPENQLSLAIGKEGQNARLAAKLTGYKIDIKQE